MELTYPNNIEEWYVKGNIQDDFGQNIYVEIPGKFNEDGTLNVEQTQAYVDQAILRIKESAKLHNEAKNSVKATIIS
jgi:hypothetical protein